MIKTLVVLALGVGAGYQIGWSDAQKHTETVVARALKKVQSFSHAGNDVDAQMERLERR